MRARIVVAVGLILGALASPAVAAQSPVGALPPARTTPAVTVVAPTASSGGGGLRPWQEALIVVAGLILLVGVGGLIVADARERAPVDESAMAHPGGDAPRPNRSAQERARARARAKAARRQRRANR